MSNIKDNNNHQRIDDSNKKNKLKNKKLLNLSIASGATVFLMAILIGGMDVSAMQAYAQSSTTDQSSDSSGIMSSDSSMQNMAMASSSEDNASGVLANLRSITGSVPVGSSLEAFMHDNINVTLADAIGFAKQSLNDNQSVTLSARLMTIQGFWVYRVTLLGNDGMVNFILVDPGNGHILDSHSFTLRQVMALRLIAINRIREDQGREPLNLKRIIFLSRLADALQNQTSSSATSASNASSGMGGGVDVDSYRIFRDINGSLPVGAGLNDYFNGIRNVTLFGDAIKTEQQNAGGNNSFALSARITIVNGFWAYRVVVLGADGMIHVAFVDIGNGKILAHHTFTIPQWIAYRALAAKRIANDDSNGLLKRPGLTAILVHHRSMDQGQ